MIRSGKAQGWLVMSDSYFEEWAREQDARFYSVTVGVPDVGSEKGGRSLISTRHITSSVGRARSVLMSVDRGFFLTKDIVHEYPLYDKHWRAVLAASGDFGRTARGAILTFLLYQCFLSCPSAPPGLGLTSHMSEYVKFLPLGSLPTLWSDSERAAFKGTTLYTATEAKLRSLEREFSQLRAGTMRIDWCARYWWGEADGVITFDDWLQVDAMYRSRALDLPRSGHCMVPALDMANHASDDDALASYETNAKGDAVLFQRPGKEIKRGDEITISYGDDKGACEMLFSYGFLDPNMTHAKSLILGLDLLDDDPLKYSKASLALGPPGVRLYATPDGVAWDSDYIWLVCVNQEDGLNFREQQTVEGERETVAFWGDEVISGLDDLRTFVVRSPMWDVILLRAISVLQARTQRQIDRSNGDLYLMELAAQGTADPGTPANYAFCLRMLERDLLRAALRRFQEFKTELAQSETVVRYLASQSEGANDLLSETVPGDLSDHSDEFS